MPRCFSPQLRQSRDDWVQNWTRIIQPSPQLADDKRSRKCVYRDVGRFPEEWKRAHAKIREARPSLVQEFEEWIATFFERCPLKTACPFGYETHDPSF